MKMQITYKTRLDFELDYGSRKNYSNDMDKLFDGVWKAADFAGVTRLGNRGGPCWGPYIELESGSLEDLQTSFDNVLTYCKRWKGIQIS